MAEDKSNPGGEKVFRRRKALPAWAGKGVSQVLRKAGWTPEGHRGDRLKFRFLVFVALMVLGVATVMAQRADKPEKPVNVTVNVPKQAPPVVTLLPPAETPLWPTYIGLVIAVLGTGATVYAALAAMRAAKATEETVNQMRQSEEDQSRPYIVISLELDRQEHWFELVLRNVGKTPAHKVIATGSEIKTRFDRYNTQKSGWPEIIASVAPGQEFRKMIGEHSLFFEEDSWHPDISFAVQYDDRTGASYSESVKLSFSAFEGTMYDNKYASLERSLKDIADNTKMFKTSRFGDPLFWRIWKSLLDSRIELVATQSDTDFVVRIRKGESASEGAGRPSARVDMTGGRALIEDQQKHGEPETVHETLPGEASNG